MYCPVCGSEYRPGITRCGSCDVDLVDDFAAGASAGSPNARVTAVVAADEPMAAYCGFLALADARHARDLLRREGIGSEIVIRDVAGRDRGAPAKEEYWLRLPARAFAAAARILGYDEVPVEASAADPEEGFACSVCGARVGADDEACPGCGERFET